MSPLEEYRELADHELLARQLVALESISVRLKNIERGLDLLMGLPTTIKEMSDCLENINTCVTLLSYDEGDPKVQELLRDVVNQVGLVRFEASRIAEAMDAPLPNV